MKATPAPQWHEITSGIGDLATPATSGSTSGGRTGIRECVGYTQATTKGTSGAPRAGGNAPKCDLATPATSGGTSGGRTGIRECVGYTQATTRSTSGAPRAGENASKCDLATPATSGDTSGGPKQTGTVNRRKPVGAGRAQQPRRRNGTIWDAQGRGSKPAFRAIEVSEVR